MAERNEISRTLGCQDAGEPGRLKRVPFLQASGSDEGKRVATDADPAPRHGFAGGD
jgi:hypothetical protein